MKLGLGTAQFGMDYGVSNADGKTSEKEVAKIVDVAARNGVRIIDTASSYGDSEEVLGRTVTHDHTFHIVTKTAYFRKSEIDVSDAQQLEQTFYQSLRKLNVTAVYGLLIHHADDLLTQGGQHLMTRMQELKQRGLVKKIGVSVYTMKQMDSLLNRFVIDIIQIPINVLDQRLLLGGYLERLKKAGVEIHARSVFLQGLLLMEPETMPRHFSSVTTLLRSYRENLRTRGISPVQAALGFVTGLKEVDAVICGVNNHRQLEELCAAAVPSVTMDFSCYAVQDETILNPSMWKL